jgi:AcrR family transcriptional regulator
MGGQSQRINRVERRREETRVEIVATAERLFLQQGIRSTSLGQIADAVGLGRPALYHYFTSKDEILSATVESIVSRFHMFEQIDGSLNLSEVIPNLGTRVLAVIRGSKADLRFLLSALLEQLDEQPDAQLVRAALERFQREMVVLLERGKEVGEVRPDLDSAAAAMQLTADLIGIEMMSLMNPDLDCGPAVTQLGEKFLAVTAVPRG